MDFRIVQSYASTPAEDVARAFRSDAMYESLSDLPFVGTPEFLDAVDIGDSDAREIRIRYTAKIDLPPVATAFVDPNKLSFVETSTVDADGNARFTIVPDFYKDLLRCTGTMKIARTGETSCERVTAGSLRINLGWKGKLLEAQVEKLIVNGLTDYLHAEVRDVEKYLSLNPSSAPAD